jgi:cytochrome P450
MWTPEYQAELYSIYRTLRDEYPVFRYENDSNDATSCWILSRYDDVLRGFRDKVNFRNADTRNGIVAQLQSSDGELHKDLRSPVFPRMGASVAARLEPLVESTVSEILDAVAAQGGCELSREVAFQVPRRIVPVFLGFPEPLAERMLSLVDPLAGYDPENPLFPGPDIGDELVALVDELLDYKRAHPGNDLTSEMLAMEDASELPPEGTAMVVRCFAFAAYDTTVNLLANGTVLLADNPDQRQKLLDNPGLIPGAIEEMLRLESPTQMIPRRLTVDVSLHGQTLSAGDEVLLLIGAAHRDERQFDNPERFDIERNPRDTIAFGSGVHTCIGRHLARLEAAVYFRQLLQRFPGFTIGARRYKASGWSRSFAEVAFNCA